MFGTKKQKMLTVTITTSATEEKWTLQGRLVWPSVNQLRETWRKAHQSVEGRTCIVDVSGVTRVDGVGERMLRTMANQGAQFVAGSVAIRGVLERLRLSINEDDHGCASSTVSPDPAQREVAGF